MVAGAYGFRVVGEAVPWLAVRGAESWEQLTVVRGGERATDPGARTFTLPDDVPSELVAHPMLGHAALAYAVARERHVLHAAVLALAGRAWLVVGDKEDGKSTVVGAAAVAGVEVLADDLAIIDGDDVLAGPRCVDLRHQPPPGCALPVTKVRSRWRLTLPPCPARTPLGGLVFLAWDDEVVTDRLPAAEALGRLIERHQKDRWPRDPRILMELAARPVLLLKRPRDLVRVPETITALQAAVSAT